MGPCGELNLDVKTGIMVEKYFLKFQDPTRQPYGIQYLDREFKDKTVETSLIPSATQ